MESNIGLQGREGIILAGQKLIKVENMRKDCMLQFMNFIVGKQYKKAMWFIIKTITLLTMTLITWNVFCVSNIFNNMQMKKEGKYQRKKKGNILQRFGSWLVTGIRVIKVVLGIERMQKSQQSKYSMNDNSLVLSVPNNLLQEDLKQNTVMTIVEREFTEEENVKPVYNLTVEHDHVYYANNILVSNCDTMYDAIKLALIDKTVIHKAAPRQNYQQAGAKVYSLYNKIDKLKQSAYN